MGPGGLLIEKREQVFQVARKARAKGQNRFGDSWLYRAKSLPGALIRTKVLNCPMAYTLVPFWPMNFLFIYSCHSSLSPADLFLDQLILLLL